MTGRAVTGRAVTGAVTVPVGQLSLLSGCLSELDRAVLSFAHAHHLQGRVDARVQQELGVTATRYYQLLAGLLDRPEAAEVAPDLIGQLRALRDRRRRLRAQPDTPRPGVRAGWGSSWSGGC